MKGRSCSRTSIVLLCPSGMPLFSISDGVIPGVKKPYFYTVKIHGPPGWGR